MYDAGILCWLLLLLKAGGWLLRDAFGTEKRWFYGLGAGLALLCLVPPIAENSFSLYPAALALALLLVFQGRGARPLRLLLLAVIGGLAGWQLIEWFPAGRLEPMLLILPALMLCVGVRVSVGEKRLLLAIAPFVSMACRALMDRFLFGYCVITIGTPEGLCAALYGLLLLEIGRCIVAVIERRKARIKALRKTNGKLNVN